MQTLKTINFIISVVFFVCYAYQFLYIPVVLWAEVNPLIGMLMIPKTCAYVWTVLIGYNAMKAEGGAEG